MSRHEHEPLTPEEREIAQRLARLESAATPSAGLDARILAAARAGAEAPPARAVAPARSRGPRWPLGMGIAASLVVAVGVAWQLRPQPDSVALDAPTEVASSRTRAEPAAPAAATDAPAAAASVAKEDLATPADAAPASIAMPLPAATAAGAEPASVERERSQAAALRAREATRQAEARQVETRQVEARQAATQEQAMPQDAYAADDVARQKPRASMAAPPAGMAVEPERAQAPAPAPPAPSAPPAADPLAPQFVPSPPPAPAAARATPTTPTASPALPGIAPTPAQERPARAQPASPALDRIEVTGSRAAAATDVVDVLADQPLDDRPPASADSPDVREHWLQRIRELRDTGQHEAARDSLREFVRRHPQARVPDDLRPLLQE